MDYKSQVQGIRNAARDIVRLHKIENEMEARANIRISKENSVKGLENLNKKIAILEYEILKLDAAHPDYDNLLKNKQGDIKNKQEDIESYNRVIADYDKELAKIDEAIDKINIGETKVCIDCVNKSANAIINDLPISIAENVVIESSLEDN